MASLKKPTKCDICRTNEWLRSVVIDWIHPNQEGWFCSACIPDVKNAVWPDAFLISRPKRNRDQCRECGAKRSEKEFEEGKNLCLDCKSTLHADYRKENAVELKKNRDEFWSKQPKGKRRQIVRNSIQRSPESFLRHLIQHIRKSSKKRRVEYKKLNPACLIVQIDYDVLLNMWKEQKARCAISKVPMTHVFNNMRTVSVDRIDSDKGYIPGNVQLVCQAINTAKRHFSNQEMVDFLRDAHYHMDTCEAREKIIEQITDVPGTEGVVSDLQPCANCGGTDDTCCYENKGDEDR